MPGGRPPRFSNCLDLDAAIQLYFEECEENRERPTITKLALALGYSDRQSLYDNEKNSAFSCIIKRARLIVESKYEDLLCSGSNPTGAIFALKNMGWSDKQEIAHSGHIAATKEQRDASVAAALGTGKE